MGGSQQGGTHLPNKDPWFILPVVFKTGSQAKIEDLI